MIFLINAKVDIIKKDYDVVYDCSFGSEFNFLHIQS